MLEDFFNMFLSLKLYSYVSALWDILLNLSFYSSINLAIVSLSSTISPFFLLDAIDLFNFCNLLRFLLFFVGRLGDIDFIL